MSSNFVVMVVRSGRAMTEAAIESVLNQDMPVKLLVVMNGVPGNDATRICLPDTVYSTVYYDVRSLSYCWNRAIEWCLAQPDCDRVMVVNNDVELRPETYRLLYGECPSYGFVTAVGDSDRKRRALTSELQFPLAVRPHPDFSCFMIDGYAWTKTGPFDEGFARAYGEDADFHVRMHRAGIDAVSLQLPFYHIASGTRKSLPTTENERIQAQAELNRAYFKRKYGCEIGSQEYYAMFHERVRTPNYTISC